MTLHFYNTETKKKEKVVPLFDNQIKMYTCGPTIYNFAHIGNFRTYVFEDLLRRTLKFFGFQVVQVMNLTDVDDKTIKGAIATNQTLADFVLPFKNAFFVDLNTLNIEKVEYYPAATDYIPHMIDFIQTLIDKGIAYRSKDKSIYFSIKKFPKYGRLSHLHLSELQLGASDPQIDIDEYDKENATDFVLWKAYDSERDGSIFWESPFGRGRPGWHLECSAMAMNLLGDSIDIHVGGVDNIFPHHENEIAQSEACSGKVFVKLWMHSEHLLVDHKKMSKSLGNFYTLRDLLDKGYTGLEVRYLLMQAHYRTQLNFTFEGLDGAKTSIERLNNFIRRLHQVTEEEGQNMSLGLRQAAEKEFKEALADDLNISIALGALFNFLHKVNVLLDKNAVSQKEAKEILTLLYEFNKVLGVMTFEKEESIPEEIQKFLQQREEARKQKLWKESDFFRDQIAKAGYLIEDTPKGPKLKKK